jgi:hypothetical protein
MTHGKTHPDGTRDQALGLPANRRTARTVATPGDEARMSSPSDGSGGNGGNGGGNGGVKVPEWAQRFGEEVARKASREERQRLREEARVRMEARAASARRSTNAPLAEAVRESLRPFEDWARGARLERVGEYLFVRSFAAPRPMDAVRVSLEAADGLRVTFRWEESRPGETLADLDEDLLHQLLAYFGSERPWEDAREAARGRSYDRDRFGPALKELRQRVAAQLAALPAVPPAPMPGSVPLRRQVWLASRSFRHWTAMYDLDRVGVLVIKSRHLKFGRVHLHWYLRGQEWNGTFAESELAGGEQRLREELEYYLSGRCWRDLADKLDQLARDGRDKPSMDYLNRSR